MVKVLAANNKLSNTVILPIDDLHLMVGIENTSIQTKVEDSLRQIGMEYPVIVVKMNGVEWWEEKVDFNPDILSPPYIYGEYNRVQCGNNRVRAARELGFTHIECILLSLDSAKELCKQLRRDKTWLERLENTQ